MTREDAFSQVYREQWPRMVGLAGRALPRGEAEDVVAEAFADAWAVARDMSVEELTRYVWRCVWNGCADLHRVGRHRREAEFDPRRQRGNEARAFEQAEARLDIGRVWGELTPKQQQVLLLRYVDDLPFPAVGAALGLTEQGAKSLAWRGWRTIERRLMGKQRWARG